MAQQSQSERLALSQQQRLQQRLSPQQVQYVRLLEMNRTEMEEAVRAELDDNPALEAVQADTADDFANNRDDEGDTFTESADDMMRADYNDPDDVPYYRTTTSNASADDEYREPVLVSESTLLDYLDEQLGERQLSPTQRLIAQYVVGNIDNNGYLQRSPAAIADDIIMQTGFEPTVADVNDAIATVQTLDPAGVGARDLREALLLQLRRHPATGDDIKIRQYAIEILDKHFEAFYKKHYDRMAGYLGVSPAKAAKAIDLIRSLNPKPGSVVGDSQASYLSQQITPDFNADIDGNTIHLTLLNSIPELQIERSFSDMNSSYSAQGSTLNRAQAEAAAFVKQKYDAASSFIRILKQTTTTLFNVGEAIVARQREFFLTGDEMKLRPMVLKDIADDTGLDISVVSRATAGKYITTQWGVFPLKYFFTEGLHHDRGEDASSREIQSILKRVIAEENKRQPLSDEQLCAILKTEGYDIARRTIAKYRKILNIPVARLRRESL